AAAEGSPAVTVAVARARAAAGRRRDGALAYRPEAPERDRPDASAAAARAGSHQAKTADAVGLPDDGTREVPEDGLLPHTLRNLDGDGDLRAGAALGDPRDIDRDERRVRAH